MLYVRRYQPADHQAVWALHNLALQVIGAHLGNGPWDADLAQIEALYLNNGGEFLVGLYEGQLVAMGALRRTSAERAEIKRMRVSPEHQGRGFGQTILSMLEQRARELGYRILHLDTGEQQVAARRLYEKNGYVEVRRGKLGHLDCIFYEKRLAGAGAGMPGASR